MSEKLQSLDVAIPDKAGWPKKTLDELCSLISRGTAPVYVESSSVLAIGQRCVTTSRFAPEFARPHAERAIRNVLRPESGDVLLNSTGTGTIGRSVVFDHDGAFIVDGHVTVLRPKPEGADGRWLNALLRTSWGQRHLERFCYAGSTNQLELSRTPVTASMLPVPSLAEQHAIAQVLDTLDTAIHATEALIDKLKAVKQGLLHDLVIRGIDANGQLRPPQSEAPQLYKESPLGWIPREWEVDLLGDVAESLIDGPFGSNLKTAHYVENPGVRVVRLQNIQLEGYDDSDRAFISDKHATSLLRNRVAGGDVLIASLGDDNYPVGRACCYPTDLPDAVNKADCFRFRAGARCHNEFIMLFMNCALVRRQVRGYEQGVTMKRINLGNLRRIVVALPDLAEQERIIERMQAIQGQFEIAKLQHGKLQQKKSGLMDDLLTGRVRVTPLLEPAQEPAAPTGA